MLNVWALNFHLITDFQNFAAHCTTNGVLYDGTIVFKWMFYYLRRNCAKYLFLKDSNRRVGINKYIIGSVSWRCRKCRDHITSIIFQYPISLSTCNIGSIL